MTASLQLCDHTFSKLPSRKLFTLSQLLFSTLTMANRTDPLANVISGTDPQNLMEYITRQKIYDSRYWKEECFGLTVADVLTKAAKLECIGNLPTRFLSLILKLLQLQPETEIILETFIEQEEFKYLRALGCMYLRLTGRPLEIYQALEPLYKDYRKLRVWNNLSQEWSIIHMDEWIHQLLRETHVLGIALPRLANRRTLQEGAYLPEGPRPTALQDVLMQYGGPINYFKHKVQVEMSEPAQRAWEARNLRLGIQEPQADTTTLTNERDDSELVLHQEEKQPKNKKRMDAKYDILFKKSSKKRDTDASTIVPREEVKDDAYWDDERAKLGLKPLRK
jgi:pre-mRNA-splicing factor 38A